MPRLLLFVPCEKPMVGADNSLSLINVLQSITLTPVKGDDAKDANVAGVTTWHVVTVWQREHGEAEGVRFQQRVTMTDPNGTLLLQTINEFEMTKLYHRNLGRIEGFPVLPGGEYLLAVSVRNTKDTEWTEKGIYPLRVISQRALEQKSSPSSSKAQTH